MSFFFHTGNPTTMSPCMSREMRKDLSLEPALVPISVPLLVSDIPNQGEEWIRVQTKIRKHGTDAAVCAGRRTCLTQLLRTMREKSKEKKQTVRERQMCPTPLVFVRDIKLTRLETPKSMILTSSRPSSQNVQNGLQISV